MKNRIYTIFYLILILFYFILGLLSWVLIIPKKNTKLKHKTIIVHKKPPDNLNDSNIIRELKNQDIKYPEIVLAQAKLETGNYTSNVCLKYNNLFGLRKNNKYYKFKHWTQSISAYKRYIQYRYTGGNYYKFLIRIKYAEDDLYIEKLKNI